MLLCLLAKVELEFEAVGGEGGLGISVPLVFLLAVVVIVCGHRLSQGSASEKKSTPSLSHLLIQPGPAEPAVAGARPSGIFAAAVPRPGLTGRERRDAIRRGGNPLPVLLAAPADGAAALDGVVLNRSRGGLLIAAAAPQGVGTLLRVRPKDAPEDVDWVVIQVRNARQKEDRWLLGCAFLRKMDWRELLIFG